MAVPMELKCLRTFLMTTSFVCKIVKDEDKSVGSIFNRSDMEYASPWSGYYELSAENFTISNFMF